MAKVKGICKLCLRDSYLCDSHVISEFFYSNLYDTSAGKHDAMIVRAEPYAERFLRKGWYDSLLCQACEEFRNRKYESYVIDIWKTLFPGFDDGKMLIIQPVDYDRVKLFFLSILWLAGESQRPEFKHVSLGPHASILREMIATGNPGSDEAYKFYGLAVIKDGREIVELVTEPVPRRVNGHQAYMFYFGGCKWLFLVSSHRTAIPCSLQRPGILLLPKAPIEEDNVVARFMIAGNKYHGTAGFPPRNPA